MLLHSLLFAHTKLIGQPVPWTVTPTGNSQTIVIKTLDSTVSYDYSFSTIGDAIGIFYDQSGTWVCAGYLQLDGITNSFLVYGNDAVDNGLQPLENYHLMYWRKSKNCIIDNPSAGMSNAQYTAGGKDTIEVLGAFPAIVQFQKDYYCISPSVGGALLQITNTTFSNLSITVPAGIASHYDPGTGNIEDISTSPAGIYTFSVTTLDNMCLRSNNYSVTLSKKLESNPVVTVTQPTCQLKTGKIVLDTATILRGTKPYIISLTGSTTISLPSGIFTSLDAMSYELIIADQNSCADTIHVAIQAPKCDDEKDIIAINGNSGYSEVYLPWEGTTKVYNSQGQLINTFATPASWDGKDQNGQYVKTGAYFIFTDGEKKKEVTVVY